MKTYLSQTSLARRLGVTNETLVARIRASGLEADAAVINGNKSHPLFDCEKLPELRRILLPKTNTEQL